MAKKAAAEVGRVCFWKISSAKIRSLDYIKWYWIWVLGNWLWCVAIHSSAAVTLMFPMSVDGQPWCRAFLRLNSGSSLSHPGVEGERPLSWRHTFLCASCGMEHWFISATALRLMIALFWNILLLGLEEYIVPIMPLIFLFRGWCCWVIAFI